MKKEKFFYFFLFLIVLFWGLYIRFDDVKVWDQNKSFYFYQELPLYSEYDSFFFARLALDIKEGLYRNGSADSFRFFPDNTLFVKKDIEEDFTPKYQVSGHFISFIWAYLSKLTGLELAKLTWWLVPFVAVSVVFPLYFYFCQLKIPWAGIFGGLVVVTSPMYWGRTNLMRLDHDILNLTLPFLIAYFFLKFFEETVEKKKFLWIILASFSLIFYQLWYGHPNLNFVLVVMFLIRYLLEKKIIWNKKDLIFTAILILPQVWYLYIGPFHLYSQVKTLVFNIQSPTSAEILFKDFPNIYMSISELQKLSFKEVFDFIVLNPVFGVVGLIGSFFVFLFYFKKLIFLFPFFIIGLLSFFSGVRFTMYLAPFIGIGLGFTIHLIFEKLFIYAKVFQEAYKQQITKLVVGTFLFLSIFLVQKPVLDYFSTPKIFAPLVRNMEFLKEAIPSNAVIWSWWDYGYAFQLYARRAVFHDGGSQGTPKTYFVARSFTTSSPEEAWNITSFISNYGLYGIAEILKKGVSAKELVEKIKEGKYVKKLETPVYWVFTGDLIPKFAWIHYFGSYDFGKKEGVFGSYITPSNCQVINKNIFSCQDLNIQLDLANGYIFTPRGTSFIKVLYIKEKDRLVEKKFKENGDYVVELIKTPTTWSIFLIEPFLEKTLFNQMFLLRKYDSKYFELVLDDFPHMVVFKVKSQPGG